MDLSVTDVRKCSRQLTIVVLVFWNQGRQETQDGKEEKEKLGLGRGSREGAKLLSSV